MFDVYATALINYIRYQFARQCECVGMENICITRICACNLCHNDKNNVMEYDYTVVMPMAFDILSPQRIITLLFGGVEWGTSNAIII